MTIQIDSRENERAITKIVKYFNDNEIKHFTSKLYVGDYMSFDNPRLIIDRKQNLTEVYSNVIQQHKRFTTELLKAKEAGIKLIILVEHSDNIKSLEDVKYWVNPRMSSWCFNLKKQLGIFGDYPIWSLYKMAKSKGLKPTRPPIESEQLYKRMVTIQNKYGTEFLFCSKAETGKRIVEILGGYKNG